jgi:UDP-N-acetyl-2-amino-2-deoxyglucuronate dehydrogenase
MSQINSTFQAAWPPIHVGLIGCGEVAARYASILTGNLERGLRLTCVTDISASARAEFAAKFGLRVLPSVEQLLDEPISLVCICTPNVTHASLAEQCLGAGKDVVLEHPMAMNRHQAERLQETVSKSGRKLFVVRQRRFLRTVQLLRAALRKNLLGEVLEVEMSLCWNRRPAYFMEKSWRADGQSGGVVLNQASHFLDLLLYLFGQPSLVKGVLGNIRHELPCEDSAFGTILFAGGIRASIECTTAAPPGYNKARLSVRGTRHTIELEGQACENFASPLPAEFACLEADLKPPLTGDHAGFLERVERHLAGVETEIVDEHEGLRAVCLIDDIYARFTRSDEALCAHFKALFSEEDARQRQSEPEIDVVQAVFNG